MKNFFNAFNLIWVIFIFSINVAFAENDVDAIVEWAHRVDLTIPVDGIINKVNVKTGQKVLKGQILVELDLRTFKANVIQAKSKVKSLKEVYEEAKRELTRSKELYERTVLSDHDLQVAKNNEVFANSQLESAKSDLVKANVRLENASLKAPFDSIILARNAEVGKAVINQQSFNILITLASSQTYLAKATLNHAQGELVNLGQKVSVIASSTKLPAEVVAIEYGAASVAGQYNLVVEFPAQDKNLHAGSKVKIAF